jgi:outer membrane protein assembly factor BamA
VTAFFGLLLLLCPTLVAQVDSRAGEIEAARREKAQHLEPDKLSKGELTLLRFKEGRTLERFSAGIAGFRVKLGGIATGGGFALGPEYLRQDLANGNLMFRAAAQASFKAYQRYDLQLSAPHFARDKLFFDFFSVHHNYPGINYYGPGPDSKKDDRSNFRLEDTSIDATFGVQPFRGLKFGASGGYLFVNVGPGTDSRFASSELVFTPEEAPGIDHQGDFARYGIFAQVDYRDNPRGARSGGNYTVAFDYFSDRTLNLHDFRRLNIDLQQFIPFFNKRRVIALRGKSTLTFTRGGQTVPFYLQPILGGSDDLRGFRPYRFNDDNMIVVNGEYRWEVFSGLDMALFADGGKVFPRRSQWNLHDLEASAGFGCRFNVRNSVFLRIDVGFGEEGPQVWFKFGQVFTEERFRSSSFH